MPIPPDPTHPKFLDGDEVLPAQEDDVQGHIRSFAVEEPGAEPEGMKTRNTEDEGSDDGEGLMRL